MDKNDITAYVEKVVQSVTENDALGKLFESKPAEAIKKILNVDLSNDIVEKIATAVKSKISLDQAKGMMDKVKGLFSK